MLWTISNPFDEELSFEALLEFVFSVHENALNLIFQLIFNDDGHGWDGCLAWSVSLQKADMEDIVNGHVGRKVKLVSYIIDLGNDGERTHKPGVQLPALVVFVEVDSGEQDFVTNLEGGVLSVCISIGILTGP